MTEGKRVAEIRFPNLLAGCDFPRTHGSLMLANAPREQNGSVWRQSHMHVPAIGRRRQGPHSLAGGQVPNMGQVFGQPAIDGISMMFQRRQTRAISRTSESDRRRAVVELPDQFAGSRLPYKNDILF